jgi:hypothetical protein
MRRFLLVLGVFLVTIGVGSSAQAQNYPWCANYAGYGGENCGFTTVAQCMATVRGNGGFCEQNTQYVPSAPSHQR